MISRAANERSIARMSSISSRIISCCRSVNVAELVLQLALRLAPVARARSSVFSGIALFSTSGDSGILPSISGMKITCPVGVV